MRFKISYDVRQGAAHIFDVEAVCQHHSREQSRPAIAASIDLRKLIGRKIEFAGYSGNFRRIEP